MSEAFAISVTKRFRGLGLVIHQSSVATLLKALQNLTLTTTPSTLNITLTLALALVIQFLLENAR